MPLADKRTRGIRRFNLPDRIPVNTTNFNWHLHSNEWTHATKSWLRHYDSSAPPHTVTYSTTLT